MVTGRLKIRKAKPIIKTRVIKTSVIIIIQKKTPHYYLLNSNWCQKLTRWHSAVGCLCWIREGRVQQGSTPTSVHVPSAAAWASGTLVWCISAGQCIWPLSVTVQPEPETQASSMVQEARGEA